MRTANTTNPDARLIPILAEIASMAHTVTQLLMDPTDHGTAAAERVARQIGGLAEAGRAILGDRPLLMGDMVDWLAPFLKAVEPGGARG